MPRPKRGPATLPPFNLRNLSSPPARRPSVTTARGCDQPGSCRAASIHRPAADPCLCADRIRPRATKGRPRPRDAIQLQVILSFASTTRHIQPSAKAWRPVRQTADAPKALRDSSTQHRRGSIPRPRPQAGARSRRRPVRVPVDPHGALKIPRTRWRHQKRRRALQKPRVYKRRSTLSRLEIGGIYPKSVHVTSFKIKRLNRPSLRAKSFVVSAVTRRSIVLV